ncbi:single-stranded DNA-binding protein [Ruficoccus sp. ZRK36]|uniref:single-stranded DNA-binding protein n=1 Tax=Ruficoccus sp. ZRK36 TaxID=2866311 RepID=UPI001C729EF0|nr:single-stranded DNA-binding protein [Ruficoccus sp. ZRK36]QYY35254.1 single-stranded DNA-binding protein [Ruficoccus sp. ZRK36]
MASFNKVILLGNLTRDPEVRVTPGGMSICKFGIAVNRTFNTKDGEKREEVTYVDIDAFGRQAEVIAKYLSKGRAVFVEGRLRLDQWDDKSTGEKRSKLGVVLENFQFVGGREDSAGGGYDQSSPPPRTTGRQAPRNEPDVDEDVPF